MLVVSLACITLGLHTFQHLEVGRLGRRLIMALVSYTCPT